RHGAGMVAPPRAEVRPRTARIPVHGQAHRRHRGKGRRLKSRVRNDQIPRLRRKTLESGPIAARRRRSSGSGYRISMSNKYDAASIEVLSGLDPVKKRPGMYTDTSRPNHLAQEVIDNSVDEAIAGHAKRIDVTLYKDGSLEVKDDGR